MSTVPPIRFNVPYRAKRELECIADAIERRHLAGKGHYNKLCTDWLNARFGFKHSFLTPSCTDALEMAAILCDIQPGDEVIVPSYTFVSTANAFATKGAIIKFADSLQDSPQVSPESIQQLISKKTKAIVAVHYGGYACDIEAISIIAKEAGVCLIEDAACALGTQHRGQPVGSFGDIATFSFHETKNITCGKGGAFVLNRSEMLDRAQVVWEKGTNRAAYFKGEVDKYGWVDYGSSFMMPEINAAFLYAQLTEYKTLQEGRMAIWEHYKRSLSELSVFKVMKDQMGMHNAHSFYGLCSSETERDGLIEHLRQEGVQAVFHYQALHNSSFSKRINGTQQCKNAERYEDCLIRLPLHNSLNNSEIEKAIHGVYTYFNTQ